MFKRTGFLCAIAVILIGCGSSSTSGGVNTSYAGQAQGVYAGTSANGYSFESIALPNDKFYGIYGIVSGNLFFVDGMMTGQGTSGNDSYTATVSDFFNTGTTTSASIAASDVPGTSVTGTVTEGGTQTAFSGTAIATSLFNYGTPASVSSISGSWTGYLMDGMSTTVTINSNGTVSGSSSGCSFTGTVTADSSGKNFFDVSLTFDASPCVAPNQTATGVGVYYLLSDGITHQLLAAVTQGNSLGTVFFAKR